MKAPTLTEIATKLETLARWLDAGLLDCGSTHQPIQRAVMEAAAEIRQVDAMPREAQPR